MIEQPRWAQQLFARWTREVAAWPDWQIIAALGPCPRPSRPRSIVEAEARRRNLFG